MENKGSALNLNTHNSAGTNPSRDEENRVSDNKNKSLSTMTCTGLKTDLVKVLSSAKSSAINQKVAVTVDNKKQRFDISNMDLNNTDDMKMEGDSLNKKNIIIPFSEVHEAFPGIFSVSDVTKEIETQSCNPEIVFAKNNRKALSLSDMNTEEQKTDRICKASVELDNSRNLTENLKSLHQIQRKEFCNSPDSDMDNVITGTRSTLMPYNLINIIPNAPNKTAIIADTKSQIYDSSLYNFSSEHSKQLIDNINNENNTIFGTKVNKQEYPYQFSGNNVQEVNFFNQQDSEINKNSLPIENMKSEVIDFKLYNSEGCKEFQKNIDGIIRNSQERKFNNQLFSLIRNSVDSKADVSHQIINSCETGNSYSALIKDEPVARDVKMNIFNIHSNISDESPIIDGSTKFKDFYMQNMKPGTDTSKKMDYTSQIPDLNENFSEVGFCNSVESVNHITSIYTNKRCEVSDAHVSKVCPYPYALSDCNMDTAVTGINIHDTIVCKMDCDEPYATIDERSCRLVDFPVLRTGHCETNVSTTQCTKLCNKSAETFTNLESDKDLSITKVKMLTPKKCSSHSSSHCNTLNCTTTNGSLTEELGMSSNTSVNKILGCDKPNYWPIGIPSGSGNINTEVSNLLNIKTEKSADSEIRNYDLSKRVNISSASLNIKTETTADNEVANSNIEMISIIDSPALLNIKTETFSKREMSNGDISKCCITSNPTSFNIKTEKTEGSEISNCDIPSSLNIKTETSISTLSNKDFSVEIFENSSTLISNKCGLNRKQNSNDSVTDFQTISKESKITSCEEIAEIGGHGVVFDKEPKPSTSKVNILSTTPKSTLTSINTAPEDLKRIHLMTSSNGNSSAEITTRKFNDESYKNKKFRREDSELYNLLTCSQNNIFRLAGSSVCPVTKGKHTKLVLQSYKCHKCSETLFTEKQLELHQITHASKYSLRSTVCDKQFTNSESHNVRSEPETKDLKFLDKVQENTHHRQESKVSISKVSDLHSDIKSKMLSGEAVITYKCDQCNEKFHFKPNVQCLPAPQQRPIFRCSICSKGFNSSCACKSHEKVCFKSSSTESDKSETDEPYDECHICGYKPWVPSRHTLRKHMSVHSTARPYKCDQCEKTFTSKRYLRCHQEQHINGEPVICKICGKSYKKSSLNSHLRKHKAISLSEKCHLCDGKFSTLGELKRHYMKHTGEKPHSCDICGKSFRMSNALRKHLSVHSNDKYLCEICGKEFRSTNHLSRHRSVHLKGKQFKCKVCGKMFNYETNLMQHLLTHSDKRNFACKLCDKKFKRPHHLRQHEQTHL